MPDKPKYASEYKSEQVELVRATCLYIATRLGDVMDDLVIIGGLVPSLIIDQEDLSEGVEPHVGTMDLDVGLQIALLNEGRYHQLTERLRSAGFKMDTNDQGNPIGQRWAITNSGTVTVDFLIPPSFEDDRGGTFREIEPDFAAIIAPGLSCAFRDRQQVTLSGRTLFGEKATRAVWVCGAGAYIVLKALAFDGRGENKDAYDLFYVVRNYGRDPNDVASKFRPLLDDCYAQRALSILKRDFLDPDGVGPMRVAAFIRCNEARWSVPARPRSRTPLDVTGSRSRLRSDLRSCSSSLLRARQSRGQVGFASPLRSGEHLRRGVGRRLDVCEMRWKSCEESLVARQRFGRGVGVSDQEGSKGDEAGVRSTCLVGCSFVVCEQKEASTESSRVSSRSRSGSSASHRRPRCALADVRGVELQVRSLAGVSRSMGMGW